MTGLFPTAALTQIADLNPVLDRLIGVNDHVTFVPMSAINAETARIDDSVRRRYSGVAKGFTPFLSGDLLVAKITPCFENGKIAQAQLGEEIGFGSTEFHVVRAHQNKVEARYLLHFLRQGRIRREGERRMTGSAGQRRVPEHFLAQLIVPLPPLSEQRRLAEILDRTDTLRATRRAALAQLDTLTQSIFFDMFGDAATNWKELDVCPLERYLLFVTSGGRGWAKYYAPSGGRFIRSLDVRMNRLDDHNVAFVRPPDNAEARRTRVEVGDVLLTITGSRIGRVASVTEDWRGAYVSQHVAILRVDTRQIDPAFLSFFMGLDGGGQRQIAAAQYGQTKPGLNFDQIRRFQIPSPPLDKQHEFVRRITAVERLKTEHRAALSQLDTLFASLQHRAFRGEL